MGSNMLESMKHWVAMGGRLPLDSCGTALAPVSGGGALPATLTLQLDKVNKKQSSISVDYCYLETGSWTP